MKRFCDRCGKEIKEGEIFYNVRIEIWADDGQIISDKEYFASKRKEYLNELLNQIEKFSAKELEEQIYKNLYYILCSDCRERFLANPISAPLENPFEDDL